MHVAETILAQLGGNRFRVMTGAKNFVGSANALQFDLARGHKMRITLTPADLYSVEYFKFNRAKLACVPVAERGEVYAEDLQEVFTDITGLFTRL